MNPKKFKELIGEISEEGNYDKQLVSEVLDFYWSNVRKSISSVAYPRINVEGLGVFRIKPTILKKTIESYKTTMGGFKSPNFQAYPRYQALKDRLDILEKASEELKIEYDRLQQIKTSKNGNVSGSMEKKG
ncbi:MAG: hypothetical protein EBU90_12485 [Proteobacteria bacterium]|nr:hypothetical protein [Pseudomonadota bacterium]NBP15171.1 hypothetical protein [bacterium]